MYSVNARDYFNRSPLLFLRPVPQNRCGQTEGGAVVDRPMMMAALRVECHIAGAMRM